MKEHKITRRNFLKVGAVASAAGLLSAAPVAASAAAPAASAAEEENCILGLTKKPKYVFLFIGDGMGTAQIQSARFYKGTTENNGAVTEGELSFTSFPEVGSVTIANLSAKYIVLTSEFLTTSLNSLSNSVNCSKYLSAFFL